MSAFCKFCFVSIRQDSVVLGVRISKVLDSQLSQSELAVSKQSGYWEDVTQDSKLSSSCCREGQGRGHIGQQIIILTLPENVREEVTQDSRLSSQLFQRRYREEAAQDSRLAC